MQTSTKKTIYKVVGIFLLFAVLGQVAQVANGNLELFQSMGDWGTSESQAENLGVLIALFIILFGGIYFTYLGFRKSESGAKKRPILITILCLFASIGLVATIPIIFSDNAKRIGVWYPYLLASISLVNAVAFIGLWTMKKWGALLYGASLIVVQLILFGMELWHPRAIIVPSIALLIIVNYYKQMK